MRVGGTLPGGSAEKLAAAAAGAELFLPELQLTVYRFVSYFHPCGARV